MKTIELMRKCDELNIFDGFEAIQKTDEDSIELKNKHGEIIKKFDSKKEFKFWMKVEIFKEQQKKAFEERQLKSPCQTKCGPCDPTPSDQTPCLVFCKRVNGWVLRYADGKGRFYGEGKKSGNTGYWAKWMVLDINNLPEIK